MLTDGGDLAKLADFGLALELKSGRCESTAEVPLCLSTKLLMKTSAEPRYTTPPRWSKDFHMHFLRTAGPSE